MTTYTVAMEARLVTYKPFVWQTRKQDAANASEALRAAIDWAQDKKMEVRIAYVESEEES